MRVIDTMYTAEPRSAIGTMPGSMDEYHCACLARCSVYQRIPAAGVRRTCEDRRMSIVVAGQQGAVA